MTLADLKEKLKDIPDNYIICTIWGSDTYEIHRIIIEQDRKYFDENVDLQKGNLVII